MSELNHTPYTNLNPDVILSAIESVGVRCTGGLFALNSYENRVYQVGVEDSAPLIAKFYRPGRWTDAAILEEHAFANELLSHEIPIIAPLNLVNNTLHTYQDYRFALYPRQSGRPLELDNLEHLEWMGRFIGRLHAVGACQPFQHRINLNVKTYGQQPHDYLLQHQFIPAHILQNYTDTMTHLLSLIQQSFDAVGHVNQLRLHGDCHAGNVLWTDAGPHIVDLDDCLMGPAIQDMWMLLSGSPDEVKGQLDRILDGYEEFYEFDYRELKLIEALRTLRMIHYSGWLARRWEDPAFPLNFPWFNTPRYWEEQMRHLQEQAHLLECAL